MGSVFVTQPDRTIRGFAGKQYEVPFYIQFVPGYVVEVVHSKECLRYNGDETINTIIALPHIADKLYKKRASAGEEYRYYPLFRTMNDVPSKGDPILLCTIGKTRYYLGPLNTINNSPTWNDDTSYKPEVVIGTFGGESTPRGSKGESPNFNKKNMYKRLEKIRKEELDYGTAVRETTGDTVIEGRHGNSLRIGSRSNNPYVFISNGRASDNIFESIGDGSLISITKSGTLQQHFGGSVDLVNETETFKFQLSSDTVEDNKRYMETLIGSINQVDDTDTLLYGYNSNQILFNSDRITINSKRDDIYLSSIKDIHIGTGRHLTISTNENLVVESKAMFIGNPLTSGGEPIEMAPMVLGDKLLEVLQDTLTALKEANGLVQGIPVPLTDSTGAPGTFSAKIVPIEQKLTKILSQYHSIEPNEGTK
tara:strand:- start:41 stop:1309 length:1269 start_codon:yes stop_codon:yes gene_type:complete